MMPRDGAKVRSFSKKASAKRSTIKCVTHPGQTKRATNQSNNSLARATVILAARASNLTRYSSGDRGVFIPKLCKANLVLLRP